MECVQFSFWKGVLHVLQHLSIGCLYQHASLHHTRTQHARTHARTHDRTLCIVHDMSITNQITQTTMNHHHQPPLAARCTLCGVMLHKGSRITDGIAPLRQKRQPTNPNQPNVLSSHTSRSRCTGYGTTELYATHVSLLSSTHDTPLLLLPLTGTAAGTIPRYVCV